MSGALAVLLGGGATDQGAVGIPMILVDLDIANGPVSALAQYDSDGAAKTQVYGGALTSVGTWLNSGLNSDYEIYVSGTGDTPTGSALDTWLALSTDRSWSLSDAGGGGLKSFTGVAQIRRASSGIVISTAPLELEVESTM